jgi:neuronal calcium sensor 1
LKEIYKQFKKETPSGVIDKKEFRNVMKTMGFIDTFLQDLVFQVFDRNRDGLVSFREFVTALSAMTRGTPDEKLECSQPFLSVSSSIYRGADPWFQLLSTCTTKTVMAR